MEFNMIRRLIIFGLLAFLIVAGLIHFLSIVDNEVDVSYGINEKKMVMSQDYNTAYDNLGNELLTLSPKLSIKEKEAQWNSSALKQEMLKEFPKFSYMKAFVKLHISDEDSLFKEKLLQHIDDVEMEYVSAHINADQAKAAL